MRQLTPRLALLWLCTWLASAAEAAGPGEPFQMSPICWILILILAIIIIVLLGLLLRERGRRR